MNLDNQNTEEERTEGREKKGNIGLEYDWSQPNLSVILL
jgi:hypothetical protein